MRRARALWLLLVASACLVQRGAAAAGCYAGQEAAQRNPPYHKEIDYAARHDVEMFTHESQRSSGFRRRLLEAGGSVAVDAAAAGEQIAADVAAKPEQPTPEPEYMRYAGQRAYRRNWVPKTPPVKPYHAPSRAYRPSKGAHEHPQPYTPGGDDDDGHEEEHAAPKAGYGRDAYARYKVTPRPHSSYSGHGHGVKPLPPRKYGSRPYAKKAAQQPPTYGRDADEPDATDDYGSASSNTMAPEATKPGADSYGAEPQPKAPGYGRRHGYHHAKPPQHKPAHSKPHRKQAYRPHKYAAQHGYAGKDEDEHLLYVRTPAGNGTDTGGSHSKPHYAKKGRHHHHKPQHVPKPVHHQPAQPYAPQPAKPYAPRHQAQEGPKPYAGTQASYGKPAYVYKPSPFAYAAEPAKPAEAEAAKPEATAQLQEPKL